MLSVISLLIAILSLCFSVYVFYNTKHKTTALKSNVEAPKSDKYEKYRTIDGLLSTKPQKEVRRYGKS
jgi:hypothetical protein